MPGVGGLPLEGLRVLEYAQYVAGPFAGMLLADLGADVVKVEPPGGDAWRRYEPFSPGESRYFYALNRNKRSVVIDLKTPEGRRASGVLLATADAVVHNFPRDRALRYGLDRESVRAAAPHAVWCAVSALGSEGPDADANAFDLVAQALSGLLLADPRPDDEAPRRPGGIALADFTAGLLAAVSVLAGLAGRRDGASGFEVSLLGAALAVQAQRFVAIEPSADRAGVTTAGSTSRRATSGSPAQPATSGSPAQRAMSGSTSRRATSSRPLAETRAGPATPGELAARAAEVRAAEALEPYYRAYRAADGFFVLTCLNTAQRRATLDVLGVEDEHVANPQAVPASTAERAARERLVRRFEELLARAPAAHWIARLRAAGIPAAEVRPLEQVFDDPQALANGLVQEVAAPGADAVRLLGGVFKVDGAPAVARRGVPALGEHTDEVLASVAEVAL